MKNLGSVWAFDLGKGSIGEAVRLNDKFPHAESLLIPAELARRGPATISGTPANRYRAMKTREAHHERERWLETVWAKAGFAPLATRKVRQNPETNKWELAHKADYRLEREFPPKLGEMAKDGAPSNKVGAETCYTSCLLRIRLLQGDKDLADWQIYKALRAALQRRGYGRVPWATKEARKQGKTPKEIQDEEDKKLQQADARYRDAVGKWPEFKRSVPPEFHFPCYYDALKMGLWNAVTPNQFLERAMHPHLAESTRNIRLDRADVRAELIKLGDQAAVILPELQKAFASWKKDGWKIQHPVTGKESSYSVHAKTFGEFLCDGPAGQPDESSFEAFLAQRANAGVQRGSFEEWMAALGQKTPSFDNRILNDCVLIPRFHVCKVDARLEADDDGKLTGKIVPESLLASEVTFLLKLKNLLVADGQRKLTVAEIRAVFDYALEQIKNFKLLDASGELTKNWPAKVANCFALARSEWGSKKALGKLGLRPMSGHEEVNAPKTSGRSAYSRVALRILKELILSGEAPSAFHARLIRQEPDLLRRLGSSADKPLVLIMGSTANDENQRAIENKENQKRGLLISELNFLLKMRKENEPDKWENIFVPSQALDALQQRHTENGKLDADSAIRDLLGTINDPVVRHRLGVFATRLKKLQHGDEKEGIQKCGVPDAIVLEFVREDFMGEEAVKKYQRFLNDRAAERKAAREEAEKLGLASRSSGLRYELFKAQGGICLYTGKSLSETCLGDYEIDHIVPRSMGGPDAAVNYVLTFHDLNHTKEKGKLTPFALLHGKEGWDAYVKRVEACATTLRNKKVQLLTRQDAPELVARYTALAETAWISKLAQAIVNLHFGWTNGYDEKRVKRVIVVSGGLTARARRKYSLDKLLYTDTTDAEVLAKKVKNREDKRHHALDAMVMTFIPQWARDPSKEGFFRFPAEFRDAKGRENFEQIRKAFDATITKVMPRYLTYEKPVLRDRVYGQRDNKAMMVQRTPLRELAYKMEKQKPVFNLAYAAIQIKDVRDARIRQELQKFIATSPDKSAWESFCNRLENGELDSMRGIRVSKVTQNLNESPVEFKDMSKDGNGAFRIRKDGHRGQFIYLDADGKPRVEVVRVFDSVAKVKAEIESRGKVVRVIGFYQSMCLVKFNKHVIHGNVTLEPGTYQLNTIKKDGRAQVTNSCGETSPEIGLSKFIDAGFKRAD